MRNLRQRVQGLTLAALLLLVLFMCAMTMGYRHPAVNENSVESDIDHHLLATSTAGDDVVLEDMSDSELIRFLTRLTMDDDTPETPSSDSEKSSAREIRVCAFNIQVFGVKKMSNPLVVQALVTILRQYDICLIQEIRDSSNTAIWKLLELINDPSYKSFGGGARGIDSRLQLYDIALSERLGRTSSKEQYAFLFNKRVATLVETYQFDDSKTDYFERPPYSAVFDLRASPGSTPTRYFFTGVHITPQAVAQEVDNLVDVYETMLGDSKLSVKSRAALRERWVMMGDFNADCRYLPKSKLPTIRLWTQKRFSWLIQDVDTTVAPSSCTYDRIVVTTTIVNSGLFVPGSADAFNYRKAYHPKYLPTEDDVKAVSDHWPVHVSLRVH